MFANEHVCHSPESPKQACMLAKCNILNLTLHLPVDHPGADLKYLTNGFPGVDEDRKVRGAKGYCMRPQRMRIWKNALH